MTLIVRESTLVRSAFFVTSALVVVVAGHRRSFRKSRLSLEHMFDSRVRWECVRRTRRGVLAEPIELAE